MFIEGADAGDAEKSLQLVKKTRLIIAGKIDCRGSHSGLPFWRARRAYFVKDDCRKRLSIYPHCAQTLCGGRSLGLLKWKNGRSKISINQFATLAPLSPVPSPSPSPVPAEFH